MSTRIRWAINGVEQEFCKNDRKTAIELVKYVSQTHYGMTPEEIERTVYRTWEE
jgi:hypothetical protein